jgi:hypothetical protein
MLNVDSRETSNMELQTYGFSGIKASISLWVQNTTCYEEPGAMKRAFGEDHRPTFSCHGFSAIYMCQSHLYSFSHLSLNSQDFDLISISCHRRYTSNRHDYRCRLVSVLRQMLPVSSGSSFWVPLQWPSSRESTCHSLKIYSRPQRLRSVHQKLRTTKSGVSWPVLFVMGVQTWEPVDLIYFTLSASLCVWVFSPLKSVFCIWSHHSILRMQLPIFGFTSPRTKALKHQNSLITDHSCCLWFTWAGFWSEKCSLSYGYAPINDWNSLSPKDSTVQTDTSTRYVKIVEAVA